MCGIAGIVDLNGARDVDRDALARMTAALSHRGPDDEGVFLAPGVGFGHRRLAIIDKEGGAQPFVAQNGAVLTYNGEIYNYQTLARELHCVTLKTRSDTELLAEGLASNGASFVHTLRGMFAFGFWEPAARRLTLARDRLGERPLYYTQDKHGFLLFASEIGALIASGRIDASIEPRAVADYVFYGYVPDPKTIFRNIYKLPPAHLLTVERAGDIRLERYWRPVFANGSTLDYADANALLREIVDDAVEAQMMSDVPLGAFLSGGVDSA
ncbi:MAG: asparagine synthase-related protein, partial [Pseudomonadota bacterium]